MLPRVFLGRGGLFYFLGAVLLAESAQKSAQKWFGNAWAIGNIYKQS